jgi:hypothetical protein
VLGKSPSRLTQDNTHSQFTTHNSLRSAHVNLKPLEPAQLYTRCDPEAFDFETTEALKPTLKIIGQSRAVEAVRFGIGIRQVGYNLYALGPNGVGKFTAVRHFLQERAAGDPTPPDICYINNFNEPHQPYALQLPAGTGLSLCQDMRRLTEELQAALPAAFESEEYQTQRQAINQEMQRKQETVLEELSQKAQERGIALMQTQGGLGFAPVREGEVVSPEEFRALPAEEREQIQGKINEMQQEMQKIMRQVPLWSREVRDKVKKLNEDIVTVVLEPLLNDLEAKYAEFNRVTITLRNWQTIFGKTSTASYRRRRPKKVAVRWLLTVTRRSRAAAIPTGLCGPQPFSTGTRSTCW